MSCCDQMYGEGYSDGRRQAIEECAKMIEKYGLARMDDMKDYPATIAAACAYRVRGLVGGPAK